MTKFEQLLSELTPTTPNTGVNNSTNNTNTVNNTQNTPPTPNNNINQNKNVDLVNLSKQLAIEKDPKKIEQILAPILTPKK